MIVNADAKSLEVYCAAFLSQDQTLIKELKQGLDMHSLNQQAFGLPSRLIAKVLVFRILYGGTAYSFTGDPDFMEVSKSEKYWQAAIDKFYEKYKGLHGWHNKIIQEAMTTGQLVMPTGRIYKYGPVRNFRGELEAPQTIIKNFPVQGLGADIMTIARVSFAKRFRGNKINGIIVNTVHDSIVCDVHKTEVNKVVNMFHEVFDDLPSNFERVFKVPFDLPMLCECGVGNNMKELTTIERS